MNQGQGGNCERTLLAMMMRHPSRWLELACRADGPEFGDDAHQKLSFAIAKAIGDGDSLAHARIPFEVYRLCKGRPWFEAMGGLQWLVEVAQTDDDDDAPEHVKALAIRARRRAA